MIVTALVLIAIGGIDLIRQFVGPGAALAPAGSGVTGALPADAAAGIASGVRAARGRRARWIALAAAGAFVLLLSIAAGAWPAGILAVACAGAWLWCFPTRGAARAGIWPVVGLAVLCAAFVALLGPRTDVGLLGVLWSLPSPWGPLSLDAALLVIGVILFLFESSNLVVRAALAQAKTVDASAAPSITPGAAASVPGPTVRPTSSAEPPAIAPLKGGRLIGPLERVVMFGLVLSASYTLLAAVLAAKGIVRFPEISRDRDTGNRAEYFLVGSLVSWVIALAAAFLVWWAFAATGV